MSFFSIIASSSVKSKLTGTLYSLVSSGLNNSYSWWVRPRSFYKSGSNYFTSIQQGDGDAYIHKYDGTTTTSVNTRIFSGAGSRDEHNAPSILDVGDGILCVSHPRNSSVFSVKKYDYNLSLLNDYGDLNSGAGFSQANYSQLYKFGNRILMFCREDLTDWAVTWSDDGGATWTAHKKILTSLSSSKLYMLGMKNDDKVTFGIYLHPDSTTSNKFKSIELDGVTGDITEAGVSKGNLYDAGFASIDFDSLTTVFQPLNTGGMRLLDISASNGVLNVLYSDFQTDKEEGQYKFKKINIADLSITTSTTICNHGRDVYSTYFGGAYFKQTDNGVWSNTIFLAREESGIWYVEEYNFNGSTFSKTMDIDSLNATNDYLSLTRPEPPFNSNLGGIKCIYQKGDYTTDTGDTQDVEEGSFNSWDIDLIYTV
jgi:hypothetical protein